MLSPVKNRSLFVADRRRMVGVFSVIAVLALLLPLPAQGDAPAPPLADAGPSRYAADDPIRLDGTGS